MEHAAWTIYCVLWAMEHEAWTVYCILWAMHTQEGRFWEIPPTLGKGSSERIGPRARESLDCYTMEHEAWTIYCVLWAQVMYHTVYCGQFTSKMDDLRDPLPTWGKAPVGELGLAREKDHIFYTMEHKAWTIYGVLWAKEHESCTIYCVLWTIY